MYPARCTVVVRSGIDTTWRRPNDRQAPRWVNIVRSRSGVTRIADVPVGASTCANAETTFASVSAAANRSAFTSFPTAPLYTMRSTAATESAADNQAIPRSVLAQLPPGLYHGSSPPAMTACCRRCSTRFIDPGVAPIESKRSCVDRITMSNRGLPIPNIRATVILLGFH